MRAVAESSALTPHVDANVETVIRSRELTSTYDPNPFGYFSHGAMFAPVADWISDTPDESVMKAAPEAFLQGAGSEPVMVILTSRDQAQIEASFAQAFGFTVPEHRYAARASAEQILIDSPNVTLNVVNFADLISTPETVFHSLAQAGWPIDSAVAAATIDPDLFRNR
jgi:hypothetical protein